MVRRAASGQRDGVSGVSEKVRGPFKGRTRGAPDGLRCRVGDFTHHGARLQALERWVRAPTLHLLGPVRACPPIFCASSKTRVSNSSVLQGHTTSALTPTDERRYPFTSCSHVSNSASENASVASLSSNTKIRTFFSGGFLSKKSRMDALLGTLIDSTSSLKMLSVCRKVDFPEPESPRSIKNAPRPAVLIRRTMASMCCIASGAASTR